MSFTKYVLLFAFVMSNAYADVSCQSTPVASCLSPDSMCLEFFEESVGDEELWEGLCDELEGAYSAGPCDVSRSVLKCLTPTNVVSPIMVLLDPMTRDEAETLCSMMQGQVCP